MQLLQVSGRRTETPMSSPNDHQSLPVLREEQLSLRYSSLSLLSASEREVKEQTLPTPIPNLLAERTS